MKEITIQIRPNSISIQGSNIQNNTVAAAEILRADLKAILQKPESQFKNELVYPRM